MSDHSSPLRRAPVRLLFALIACALWGSAIPCIKLSYALFGIDTDNPGSLLLFAGVRFALAGVLVLLAGRVLEKHSMLPQKADWLRIGVVSLFQTVLQYLCYYLGLRAASGVSASILVGTNSFFAIFVAALAFRMEKLTRRKLAGCAIGFAGVVLSQIGAGFQFSFSLRGEGLILLSTLSAAFSAALTRRCSAHCSPVLLSGWQFFLGGVVLALTGLVLGGQWGEFSFASSAMLLYLALVSAVAYTLWSCLLKENPVSQVSIYGFLTPVFGVVLSALLLGEHHALGVRSLAALALVCAGIFVVNRVPETEKAEK